MKDSDQKKAAKEFINYWKDRGNEKSESQKFWMTLLTDVYGVKDIKTFINFEDSTEKLMDGKTGWVDGYIPSTKVLIEQKSSNVELDKKVRHGDINITAFQQAWLYSAGFNYDERPRWIVTCNFKSFRIYDMNNRNSEPEEVLLENLEKEYYRLQFLVDSKNDHIKKEEELSFQAGELVGKLYDAFSKQYKDLTNEQSQKDLNELCVRLVFCLYAEDAGIFGRKNVFHDYLSKYDDLSLMRENLIKLFKILDTPLERRDPYLENDLNQFPYVNGGLFSNENIEIPTFTEEIRNTLLARASNDFDWSDISPTIFGAVFESTLNQETRRSGGMHYTSIENIHKVIDPLFLDELRKKLNDAESYKNEKTRNEKLIEFQDYLSSLTFFDPACGSGNFLTETYLSLRRLENEALEVMEGRQIVLGSARNPIKVNINQFYGIEINNFAVKVAKAALWIAESQMMKKTKEIVHINIDFLPLKTYDNIVQGNALTIDWNDVIKNNECSYIMGNPPFIGGKLMNNNQRSDMLRVWGNIKLLNSMDYVSAWYKKAIDYMINTNIETALVSTNSICQGEQVEVLWKKIFASGIKINFAHRTFRWDSEANIKAHVHCVVIGFSYTERREKIIYDNGKITVANNINGYLMNCDNYFVEKRSKPLCNVKKIVYGNMPNDDGNLIFTQEEYKQIINKYPESKHIFKRFVDARDFLNNEYKYCLWLVNIDPKDYINIPEVTSRIKKVKIFRENSTASATKEKALQPMLFFFISHKNTNYILIPRHSSEKRRYIPIGFMDADTISSDANMIIPDASLYDFGILMSNVHMAWMRTVAGRLEMRYRYSNSMVYNTFPWPNPTKEQKEKIEKTAQMILDARKEYSKSKLSDLYSEKMYLYTNLLKAHQMNDIAVWEAYGKKWNIKSESDCISELMKMYQNIISQQK